MAYFGNWTELKRRDAARLKLKLRGHAYPAANIGRAHPDYGMTVGEHEASKAQRLFKAAA